MKHYSVRRIGPHPYVWRVVLVDERGDCSDIGFPLYSTFDKACKVADRLSAMAKKSL